MLATEPHFADHLRPIWRALMREERGYFFRGRPDRKTDSDTVVVASATDMLRARKLGKRVVYMDHGCGLSYRGTANPSYAGSTERPSVGLILSPNEYHARRSRRACPGIEHVVVGCPKMDEWHRRPAKPMPARPTVAVSFHWNCEVVPETRWAFPHFRSALPALARSDSFDVIGHAHPRAWKRLRPMWEELGVEPVQEFSEVMERADCYVVDNSSTLYEFASLDRPVVVMNAPWYRRNVQHGLRFWEHVYVGVNADEPFELLPAVELALLDEPKQQELRRNATYDVYPIRVTATAAAVRAIRHLP